jgi:hypothetical protein
MPIAAKDEEIAMLRAELELLMKEREGLLRIAGAAAAFIANMDVQALPRGAYEAADKLAESLNGVPDDTLKDALGAVKAKVEFDIVERRQRERYARSSHGQKPNAVKK